MSISYDCPACGEHYELHDSLAGKSVRCKQCRETSAVPANAAKRSAAASSSGYALEELAGGPAVSRPGLDDEGPAPWRGPAPRAKRTSSSKKSDGSGFTLTKGGMGVGVLIAIVAVRIGLRLVLNEAFGDGKKDNPQVAEQHAPGPMPTFPHMPSGPRIPPLNPPTSTRATLSNAHASPRQNAPGEPGGIAVNVDFQFQPGAPRPNENYVWVIEARNRKAKQTLRPGSLAGSLSGDVASMQPGDGPFTTYLAVQQAAGLKKITDTVPVPYSTEPVASNPEEEPAGINEVPVASGAPVQNVAPQNGPGMMPTGRPGIGFPNQPRIRAPQMPPIRGPRGPRFRSGRP